MTPIRRWGAAAAALVYLGGSPSYAQNPDAGKRRTPRSLIFGGIGALVAGGLSAAYASAGSEGDTGGGNCTSSSCVMTVATISGGLVGFMIGREIDQLHELRYRGARALQPRLETIRLGFEANVVTARDSMVAAAGRGGVQFALSGRVFRPVSRRASGLRGIADVALGSASGLFGISSATGVYVFPVDSGPGSMIRDGASSASATRDDTLYFAVGNRVERAPLAADTVRTWPGVDLGARTIGLANDSAREIVWAVTEGALFALRPAGDSLTLISRTALQGRARRLAVTGTTVAIAFGEEGVAIFDVASPESPSLVSNWIGARFAYDVALYRTRVFVAAGPDGMYVLERRGNELQLVGLARDVGFAAFVTTGGPYTYVYDRSGMTLQRLESIF